MQGRGSSRTGLGSTALVQRFSIQVLAPPRSAYFACLSLLTHLIQIISLLEVRSMHELCSDWHAPYTGSIAPYSLSRGNPLKFTLFRNIHSWIFAAQRLHARTSVTSYTSVNIYNFNSRLAHFNAFWMEYISSLRAGIMAEYPVMSTLQGTYVRIEQTSENNKCSSLKFFHLTTIEAQFLLSLDLWDIM